MQLRAASITFWDDDWNVILTRGVPVQDGEAWRQFLFHYLPFELSTVKIQPHPKAESMAVRFITLEIQNV